MVVSIDMVINFDHHYDYDYEYEYVSMIIEPDTFLDTYITK